MRENPPVSPVGRATLGGGGGISPGGQEGSGAQAAGLGAGVHFFDILSKDVTLCVDISDKITRSFRLRQLATQTMHRASQAHLAHLLVAPDVLHQLVLAEHLLGVTAEAVQHAPLHRREVHQGVALPEGLVGIQLEGTEAEGGHGWRSEVEPSTSVFNHDADVSTHKSVFLRSALPRKLPRKIQVVRQPFVTNL